MKTAKQINIGIVAHVDAGKTTLAEALLHQTGSIRKAGRVDHGDAFLDTYALEKERGITIFSKQANFQIGDTAVTLLDTPGHVDFSAEMERVLQVLDYVILVISGTDGVQSHVMTLWRLLEHYHLPTFLFINKMDQVGADRSRVMGEIRERLGERCVLMDPDVPEDALMEELALCDDIWMEEYLETGKILTGRSADVIAERKLCPCLSGSALHMQGIDTLLEMLGEKMQYPVYQDDFSARVYKISREDGVRLTHLKVTGGCLRAKQAVGTEKVDQIRVYSGEKFTTVPLAEAGMVCAVSGLQDTFAGQGLGAEKEEVNSQLESVLSYGVYLPEGVDEHTAYQKLKELEEEIPELHMNVLPSGQISVSVMGEVQIEILQKLIEERYGWKIEFGEGDIIYKETITKTVEGVGHFEPLRHYAEAHLLLEPLEEGSGIEVVNAVPKDTLDQNWQSLGVSYLLGRLHRGVLINAPITDMRLTLAAGKTHLKHTEGSDFREAVYRALRQGLMEARSSGSSRLLEPVYAYRLEIPDRFVGKAMSDLQMMHAVVEGPFQKEGQSVLTGRAPVSTMRNYHKELAAYTSGEGRLYCDLDGYMSCHNEQEVLEKYFYDPEADTDNPCGSVFCSHGAGVFVPWQEVKEHMHVPAVLVEQREEEEERAYIPRRIPADIQDDDELREIFERTYGSIKKERGGWKKSRSYAPAVTAKKGASEAKPPCLLVDGYNIIFAWKELDELAKENMDAARGRLLDIMSNYQGYRKMTVIIVFDAYRVKGGEEKTLQFHNVYVVYTKEAETADAYIERTVTRSAGQYDITVASSDAAEQVIIWGQGAKRMSAPELYEEVQTAHKEMRTLIGRSEGSRRYLFDEVDENLGDDLEKKRLGREPQNGKKT